MVDEFPAELVERCALAVARVTDPTENFAVEIESKEAIAVLRESGYAELVAALKEARHFAEGDAWPKRRAIIIAKIDAALKKAGAP